MILKGLDAIHDYLEAEHSKNLKAWYERNIGDDERPRGMRKDVYVNGQIRNAERRRIQELEDRLERIEEERRRQWASDQMHMAMGCDDRDCNFC